MAILIVCKCVWIEISKLASLNLYTPTAGHFGLVRYDGYCPPFVGSSAIYIVGMSWLIEKVGAVMKNELCSRSCAVLRPNRSADVVMWQDFGCSIPMSMP